MKVKFGKVCRGGGVIYIDAQITVLPGTTEMRVSAKSECGVDLPVEVYYLNRHQSNSVSSGGAMRNCVLATPMLNTSKIIFTFEAIGAGRDVIDSKVKRVRRTLTKWLSRLNYKLNYGEVSHLRDIDRFTYSDQIHIKPMYCSVAEKRHQLVVKGIICTPSETGRPQLQLLASDGNQVDEFSPYLLPTQQVVYDGVPRAETSFTARIPDDGNAYCLVAKGEGDVRSGFMSLYKGRTTPAFTNHFMFYYRAVWAWIWPNLARDHARKYELANPRDYVVANGPKISIVVPLYNTPVAFLREMVQSVLDQLYTDWELVLVNSTPDNQQLCHELDSISDDRVKILTLSENLGISENTNAGIQACTGEYIAFFDHDDVLDKLVLFRYAKEISEHPEIDALYCDEDILSENGEYSAPHFKSDFNLDLLRAHNYVTHLLTVRADYVRDLMLRKEYDGAQDYDFVLRLAERTDRFAHIPEVLYHWRASATSTASNSQSKPYAQLAGLRALDEHLSRCSLSARAAESDVMFFYKTSYRVEGSPLVSIIIPNKDSVEVLSRCVDSLEQITSYKYFEVVIVENNSVCTDTFKFYDEIQTKYDNVRVITWPDEFNYSNINNYGAEHARGDYLLLLNNDTEIIEPNWLDSMLGFCQRKDVAVVGAKLLYPDDTIQHAGVAMLSCKTLAEVGGPVHVFCHLDKDDCGYMNRAAFSQDVSVVTGACLLTKRSVFDQLGGLSERYAVAYNDVDYCLRAREAGYLVVYDADAVLYHYESFSRGSDEVGERAVRFVTEQGKLREDWPEYFTGADPYYGKYLNLV